MIFFYLNADTFEFLWGDYRRYVVVVFAALAVALILAALTWRFETMRLSRLASGLTLVAAIAVAGTLEFKQALRAAHFDCSRKTTLLSPHFTYRGARRGHSP